MKKLSLLLLAAVLLVGCNPSQISSKKINHQDQEVVKIGAIIPLTGPASLFGQHTKNGIQFALEKYGNDNIQIIFEDSQGKPDLAISAFNKLVNLDQVSAIIVDSSSVASSLVPLADKEKIPLLLNAVVKIGIVEKSEYIFRNFYVCDTAMEVLSQKIDLAKVDILMQNDDYGQSCADILEQELLAQGTQIGLKEKFSFTDKDFKDQLNKIKQSNSPGLYIVGYENPVLIITQQLKELGINKHLFGDTIFYSPDIKEEILANINPPDLHVVVPKFYADKQDPEITEFINAYKTKNNKEPSFTAAYAHDTTLILIEAVKSGAKSRQDFKNALSNIEIDGINGKIRYGPDREAKTPLYFVKVEKDGLKILE